MQDELRHESGALGLHGAGGPSTRRRAGRGRTATVSAGGPRGYRMSVARAVARARLSARLDCKAFADALRLRLQQAGEPVAGVTGETVAAWEGGAEVPSALTLLAAADVAGVDAELLFNRLPVAQRLEQLEQLLRSQAVQVDELQLRWIRRA